MTFKHSIPAESFYAACDNESEYTFSFKICFDDFQLATNYYLTKMDLLGGLSGGDPRYLLKEEVDSFVETSGYLGSDSSICFPVVPKGRILVLQGSTYPKIIVEVPPATGGSIDLSFVYSFNREFLAGGKMPSTDVPIITCAEIHFFAFAQVIRHVLLAVPFLPENDGRRALLKMIQTLKVRESHASGRGWCLDSFGKGANVA